MSDDDDTPTYTRRGPTKSEMLLVINDIHNRAIAARLAGGDDGTLMLEIEQLAEDVLVCFDETSEEITFTAAISATPTSRAEGMSAMANNPPSTPEELASATTPIWTGRAQISFEWVNVCFEFRLFANKLFVGCVYRDDDDEAPSRWAVVVSNPTGGEIEGHFEDHQEARDYLLDWGIRNVTGQSG